MDGNGANWHYNMETDIECYEWKRRKLALFNGNGYGILWMETEPSGII